MSAAFDTLGIDQAEMNMQGFHYHAEILKRMRKQKPDGGSGADAASIRGLLRFSRKAQDRVQEFLFPSKPRSVIGAKAFAGLVAFAEKSDRWLAERAPAT
jgi:hypothetical protein